MTPIRRLLSLLLPAVAVACGGGGGVTSESPPRNVVQKGAVSGDSQSAVVNTTLPTALAVVVLTEGVPDSGVPVHFTPAAGAGVATPAVDTTGADGVATTHWTLGTASGARTLSVAVSGASGSPILFRATALPGAAVALSPISGQSQVQEVGVVFPQSLIVKAGDAFGNGVPGVIVAWQVTAGEATLGQSVDTTGADGRSAITLSAGGTPGVLTVTAAVADLAGSPAPFSLNVTPVATVVTVGSNFFSPQDIVIPAGGAVRWTWNAGVHNVSPVTGPATFQMSSNLNTGATYGPLVFEVAGVYTYECTLHVGMTGTITVGAAGAPQPGVLR